MGRLKAPVAMRVVASYSIKGGVGKSTTAVNLAWVAAQAGYRTVLWDLDPQGAASYCFRIRPKVKGGARGLLDDRGALAGALRGTDYPNLDLLPADFSLRKLDTLLDRRDRPRQQLRRLAVSLAQDYDFMVLDCPPGISIASESVFRAADVLLVPVIPAPLAMRTLDQLKHYLRRKGPEHLVVRSFFSMADGRKKLHKDTVARHLGRDPDLLRCVIPYAAPVELMSERRAPLGAYAPGHPLLEAYRRLWSELMRSLATA
jgi:cellulose biosynthesis protein BcsQ